VEVRLYWPCVLGGGRYGLRAGLAIRNGIVNWGEADVSGGGKDEGCVGQSAEGGAW